MMKRSTSMILLISAYVLLIIGEELQAAPQSGGIGQKPGNCQQRRGRRSAEWELIQGDNDDFEHSIQKRQVQGGNPWQPQPSKPTAPPASPVAPGYPSPSECRYDSHCSGNKKCCSGTCRTPVFYG